MSDETMDDEKKTALVEYFREAVIGQLCMGEDYVDEAMNEAKAKGVTDEDFETLMELTNDGKKFFEFFGEDCLSKSDQALIKCLDDLAGSSPFGGMRPFEGLYPKLKR